MQNKPDDLRVSDAEAGGRSVPKQAEDSRRGLFAMVIAAVFLGFVFGGIYFRNHPTPEAALRSFHMLYFNDDLKTWTKTSWL